jgi:hypothetical protein
MVGGVERLSIGPSPGKRPFFDLENLRIAQSHQKIYADRRRRELHFKVGDHVYLKVSPFKGTRRFRVKGKLAPCFVGPFRVTKRVGMVAYQLDLPQSLSTVHNVFHVSQLKKCLRVPTDAIDLETLDLQAGLTYEEHPIAILDYDERKVKYGEVCESSMEQPLRR